MGGQLHQANNDGIFFGTAEMASAVYGAFPETSSSCPPIHGLADIRIGFDFSSSSRPDTLTRCRTGVIHLQGTDNVTVTLKAGLNIRIGAGKIPLECPGKRKPYL